MESSIHSSVQVSSHQFIYSFIFQVHSSFILPSSLLKTWILTFINPFIETGFKNDSVWYYLGRIPVTPSCFLLPASYFLHFASLFAFRIPVFQFYIHDSKPVPKVSPPSQLSRHILIFQIRQELAKIWSFEKFLLPASPFTVCHSPFDGPKRCACFLPFICHPDCQNPSWTAKVMGFQRWHDFWPFFQICFDAFTPLFHPVGRK